MTRIVPGALALAGWLALSGVVAAQQASPLLDPCSKCVIAFVETAASEYSSPLKKLISVQLIKRKLT